MSVTLRGIRCWIPVAVAVLFNAWCLRSELSPGAYPNDGSFHRAYLDWAATRLSHGDSPLDGIFPQLGLGFPIFQHYQVLPHLLMAPVAWLLGTDLTYGLVLYLLLALWPVCVYVSVRLFELDRWTASAAAVLAPLVASTPGYGFELSSYAWRGWGMWTQAWGMWLFALTAACVWRALLRDRSLALAAGLLAATFTSHLLTGLTLAAVVLVWPLLDGGPRLRGGRLLRALAIVGGGALASAWLLVPSWIDRGSTSFANPERTFWRDSYGPGQVMSWLVRGELFDAGRLPVLTAAFAIGVCALVRRARRSDNARAIVGMLAVSLVLFFGTSVVGPIVDRMPMREVLFLHRMIVGVHFAGIVIAGAGVVVMARWMQRRLAVAAARLPRWRPVAPALGIAACLVALAPAWTQLRSYFDEQSEWVHQQQATERTDGRDFAALAATAATADGGGGGGGGRIYAGSSGDWGRDYRIGHVPGYIELLNLGARGVGFTGRVPAVTEPSEARFDAESRAQADMFDVRWQIRPAGMPGPPGAVLAEARGRHRLWWTETSGAVQVARAGPAIPIGREGVAVASMEFLRSDLALEGVYPLLGQPSTAAGVTPGGTGRVFASSAPASGDRYAATVIAERPAIVVVKTSTHPRWSARVDGRPVRADVVAPGLVAIPVPAGQHQVTLRFAGFPVLGRVALVAMGLLGLVALAAADRRKPEAIGATEPGPRS